MMNIIGRNVKSPELEDIFVICSVLAQCAIDSAKRIYSVNINTELNKIRDMEVYEGILRRS